MEGSRVIAFSYNFFYPVPLALCLLIIRRFIEKYCFEPIGISFGIKPLNNRISNTNSEVIGLLKSSAWLTPTQVSYINKYVSVINAFFAKQSSGPSKISRFSRSCWHFSYYLVEFSHGMFLLWNKPWLWDLRECWTDFARQKITTDIWIFYVMNLAYYWSLLIKLFLNKKRKDFAESAVHHAIAILLIYISLASNSQRIGSIVIVVLFVSDIFLEGAKIFKYLEMESSASACFLAFTCVWTVTRLGLYPFWIIRHIYTIAPKILVLNPAIYVLLTLLLLIQVLNCFWSYQIIRLLWRIIKGQNMEDERSDSETDEDNKTN